MYEDFISSSMLIFKILSLSIVWSTFLSFYFFTFLLFYFLAKIAFKAIFKPADAFSHFFQRTKLQKILLAGK